MMQEVLAKLDVVDRAAKERLESEMREAMRALVDKENEPRGGEPAWYRGSSKEVRASEEGDGECEGADEDDEADDEEDAGKEEGASTTSWFLCSQEYPDDDHPSSSVTSNPNPVLLPSSLKWRYLVKSIHVLTTAKQRTRTTATRTVNVLESRAARHAFQERLESIPEEVRSAFFNRTAFGVSSASTRLGSAAMTRAAGSMPTETTPETEVEVQQKVLECLSDKEGDLLNLYANAMAEHKERAAFKFSQLLLGAVRNNPTKYRACMDYIVHMTEHSEAPVDSTSPLNSAETPRRRRTSMHSRNVNVMRAGSTPGMVQPARVPMVRQRAGTMVDAALCGTQARQGTSEGENTLDDPTSPSRAGALRGSSPFADNSNSISGSTGEAWGSATLPDGPE